MRPGVPSIAIVLAVLGACTTASPPPPPEPAPPAEPHDFVLRTTTTLSVGEQSTRSVACWAFFDRYALLFAEENGQLGDVLGIYDLAPDAGAWLMTGPRSLPNQPRGVWVSLEDARARFETRNQRALERLTAGGEARPGDDILRAMLDPRLTETLDGDRLTLRNRLVEIELTLAIVSADRLQRLLRLHRLAAHALADSTSQPPHIELAVADALERHGRWIATRHDRTTPDFPSPDVAADSEIRPLEPGEAQRCRDALAAWPSRS